MTEQQTHRDYREIPGYNEIVEHLRTADDFAIGSHEQPDGDAVGSSFALQRILSSLGKKARVLYAVETIPKQYGFLVDAAVARSRGEKVAPVQRAIVIECPGLFRLGTEISQAVSSAESIINLDHHTQNDRFGHINLLIPEAPAAAEIIYRIALDLGATIDERVATALYVGLLTDTGKFQYNNTTPDTHRVAAELLEYGINPNEIYQRLFEQTPFAVQRLFALVLGRLQLDKDSGLCWSVIRRTDIKRTGANMLETEGFVDTLRSTSGTSVAVLLKETATGHRVSLRSRDKIDVAAFAERFGGGGHRLASGCKTSLPARRFITLLRRYINEGELPPVQPSPASQQESPGKK